MNVAFLSPSGEPGGAERCLLDLVAGFRERHPTWSIDVVLPSTGSVGNIAARLGATVTVFPYPPALATLGEHMGASPAALARMGKQLLAGARSAARYASQLRAHFQATTPHIVHSHGLKMHALAARACDKVTPLVWHMHDYVGARVLSSRLLRWHAGRSISIVANSSSVAEDVKTVLGSETPVTVVLNGVDLAEFAPGGMSLDLDAIAGLPPAPAGVVRVGLVATFARWKGHAAFFNALSLLPPDLHVRGYVVGGPIYRTEGSQYSLDELRRLATSRGLEGRVGFTGFIDRSAQAIRALDVVVHASTAPEPFGLVIAEAMACGRAVVVSDAGGARELVTAGVDALTHAPGNAEDLASAIAALARDSKWRAALGTAAHLTASRRFDRRRMVAEIEPVYTALTHVAA
jgi:glycosyltransferase involved in cell wall biosynthesis